MRHKATFENAPKDHSRSGLGIQSIKRNTVALRKNLNEEALKARRDHGDGGLDERGENRWRLRYWANGRRHTKTVHGTKKDAKEELRRALKSVDDGAHIAPGKLPLATWVDRWLALLERHDGDGVRRRRGLINRRSWERYEELCRLHIVPFLGKRPLQQITPSEIDALYIQLEQRMSARTVRYVHVTLNACLGCAVRKGLIASNPVARAEAPAFGEGASGQVLDQDQLAVLLSGFRNSALYAIVAIAAFTGARRNEILALRWSDFDSATKTLTIERAVEDTRSFGRGVKEPKSARGRRTIAIDDALCSLLLELREKHLRLVAGIGENDPVDLTLIKLPECALIFPAPPLRGTNFEFTKLRAPKTITKEFAGRARKLGFPKLRFHDLRATHETLLLDAGVPVHVVAARCGHDPAVLLRSYAKRTKKADASAAAIIGAMSAAILGV